MNIRARAARPYDSSMPTREIFRNFSPIMQVLFYLISFLSMGVFFYGFYRRIQKYRRGRAAHRLNQIGARFWKAAKIMAQNSTVWKNDAYAGFAHTLIFWGFVVLFIGTVIVFIDHDMLRFIGIHLLQGPFYLGFSFVLDIFGVLFLVGLLMMMVRRKAMHPPQLDYTRVDLKPEEYNRSGYSSDDRIFLALLFVIGVTGFLIEAFRI
ncbi:MAG TPA: Fe-S oxidoreductase, partial [Acidobacteriota bacterium]